jgi:hypothetical protein
MPKDSAQKQIPKDLEDLHNGYVAICTVIDVLEMGNFPGAFHVRVTNAVNFMKDLKAAGEENIKSHPNYKEFFEPNSKEAKNASKPKKTRKTSES